jgi:hypothetical protein
MKSRKPARKFLWGLLFIGLCLGAFLIYDRGRPVPVPMEQTLYEGVTYRRIVKISPRPLIAHVIVVDTKVPGISFLVTPPDADGETPLNAPSGLSASGGDVYSEGILDRVGTEPTLFISRRNALSFNRRPGNIYHAISGDRMLLQQGKIVEGLDNSAVEPRSAVGINRNGRFLYLIVVDGRQPFYSDGATFMELAQLLLDQGAYFAMALDGGGSSTLVRAGADGAPVILNSPIDNYIPGRERPVGNHLGVFAP